MQKIDENGGGINYYSQVQTNEVIIKRILAMINSTNVRSKISKKRYMD